MKKFSPIFLLLNLRYHINLFLHFFKNITLLISIIEKKINAVKNKTNISNLYSLFLKNILEYSGLFYQFLIKTYKMFTHHQLNQIIAF